MESLRHYCHGCAVCVPGAEEDTDEAGLPFGGRLGMVCSRFRQHHAAHMHCHRGSMWSGLRLLCACRGGVCLVVVDP